MCLNISQDALSMQSNIYFFFIPILSLHPRGSDLHDLGMKHTQM